MKRTIAILIFLLVGLIHPVMTVNAQEPEKSREFVYGMNVFVLPEQDYAGKFAPPSVDTIYLLADVASILSPRYTLVYYWAITNEYKADWDNLNETVAGALEISSLGSPTITLEQTQYVIQYPNGLGQGNVQLSTGAEALAKYERFLAKQTENRDAIWDYYQKYQEFLLASSQDSSLQPPLEPEPLTLASTGLNAGFPINLPAGEYSIQVREPNGNVIPESKKKLVVFSPKNTGVGFLVIPADKYVSSERSDHIKATIYTRPDETLYLQPYQALEFNQLSFTRSRNPQSQQGEPNQVEWVYLQEETTTVLQVNSPGASPIEVQRQPFWVEQLAGSALGYKINPNPSDPQVKARTPDFEGFQIITAKDQPILELALFEKDTGKQLTQREIRVAPTQNKPWLFVIPLLPLGAYAIVFLLRKRYRAKPILPERS